MAQDKAELRQLVSVHVLQGLDAIAMAKGLERHAYVEAVLSKEVMTVAHEASVIARCLHGNPLASETNGGRAV